MTKTAILIPARYGSKRFAGKPLADLGGLPMIKRVVKACRASGLDTYVLTDNALIASAAVDVGADVWCEETEYDNGTDRCAGVMTETTLLDRYDHFINVQGDMPDVTLDMIDSARRQLSDYSVVTLFADMDPRLQNDPNAVKMVRAGDQALWFGRGMTGYGDHHLGVYGYRRKALAAYKGLDRCKEEDAEGLEQLRWLKNGCNIGVTQVAFDGIEINTPEDVLKWEAEQ
jgi:CMP-2-keto-3-deoxyoctulosonic acid synthetase